MLDKLWQACIQDCEGDNRDWDACLWLIGGGGTVESS